MCTAEQTHRYSVLRGEMCQVNISKGRLVGLTYWAVTFWSPAGASTVMRVSTNVMQKMTL